MNTYKNSYIFKVISLCLILSFGLMSLVPNQAFAQTLQPASTLLSPSFTPTLVRGIRVYPDNPFQFDFIVDSGDTGLRGDALKQESEKLIRYFLASLTLPENDLWVNLSPHEKDRIVPKELGATEMGIDMLSQDYLLKKITASLTNPDSDLGKEFWSKVYQKAYEQYGTTNIPVDTFNKVWIMPDKATVYVQEDKAFITESRLKVMLETDYLAAQVNSEKHLASSQKDQLRDTNDQIPDTLSSQIVREVFIPALEKEVNEGKNFAQLRQIYNCIILSYWYKTNLKNSILNKVYSDKRKVKGLGVNSEGYLVSSKGKQQKTNAVLDTNDQIPDTVHLSQVDQIYSQYLATFKQGVCNLMRVEYDPYAKKSIPRKYFAGGVDITHFGDGAGKAYHETRNKTACSAIFNRLHKTALAILVTFDLLASNGDALVDDKSAHAEASSRFTNEYLFKDLQTSLFQRFQDSSVPSSATIAGSPKERSLREKEFYVDMAERFDLSVETVMAVDKLLLIGFKQFRSGANAIPAWKVLSLNREPEMTNAIVQEDFEEFYFYVLDRFGLDPRSRWFEDVFGVCDLYVELQRDPDQRKLFESDQFTNTLDYLRAEFPYVFIGPQVALQVLDLSRTFDSKAIDDLRQRFSQQYPKEKIRINDLFLLEYIRHDNELFPLLFDRKALEQKALETIYQQPVEVRKDDDIYYPQERKDPASIGQYPTLFLLGAQAFFNTLQNDPGFRIQIKELYRQDIQDTTAEYGGIVWAKDNKLYVKKAPSYMINDDALFIRSDFRFGMLDLHFHTAFVSEKDTTYYPGPSSTDFMFNADQTSFISPGVVLSAVRFDEGFHVLNVDFYRGSLYKGPLLFKDVPKDVFNLDMGNIKIPVDPDSLPTIPMYQEEDVQKIKENFKQYFKYIKHQKKHDDTGMAPILHENVFEKDILGIVHDGVIYPLSFYDVRWIPESVAEGKENLYVLVRGEGEKLLVEASGAPQTAASSSVNPLINKLKERIKAEGKITFRDYMEVCLQDPEYGYYAGTKASVKIGGGASAHFDTYPEELHPVFGGAIALQLMSMWEAMGKPPTFDIVEMGAGNGTLARDILDYLFSIGFQDLTKIQYKIFDISPKLREAQKAVISQSPYAKELLPIVSHVSLGDLREITGVFLSNELPDTFPAHRIKWKDGKLQEVYVGLDPEGNFVDVLSDISTPKIQDYVDKACLMEGSRNLGELFNGKDTEISINLEMEAWYATIAKALTQGFILTIDYGFPGTSLKRYQKLIDSKKITAPISSRMYSHHQNGGHDPYFRPGEEDITTDVYFPFLNRLGREAGLDTVGYLSQARLLINWGLASFMDLAKESGATFMALVHSRNVKAPARGLEGSIDLSSLDQNILFELDHGVNQDIVPEDDANFSFDVEKILPQKDFISARTAALKYYKHNREKLRKYAQHVVVAENLAAQAQVAMNEKDPLSARIFAGKSLLVFYGIRESMKEDKLDILDEAFHAYVGRRIDSLRHLITRMDAQNGRAAERISSSILSTQEAEKFEEALFERNGFFIRKATVSVNGQEEDVVYDFNGTYLRVGGLVILTKDRSDRSKEFLDERQRTFLQQKAVIVDGRMDYLNYIIPMIALMFETDFKDKVVWDYGAGMGVLGLIALRLGAKRVIAVENNEGKSDLLARAQVGFESVLGKENVVYLKGSAWEKFKPQENQKAFLLEADLNTILKARNNWRRPIDKKFVGQDPSIVLANIGAFYPKVYSNLVKDAQHNKSQIVILGGYDRRAPSQLEQFFADEEDFGEFWDPYSASAAKEHFGKSHFFVKDRSYASGEKTFQAITVIKQKNSLTGPASSSLISGIKNIFRPTATSDVAFLMTYDEFFAKEFPGIKASLDHQPKVSAKDLSLKRITPSDWPMIKDDIIAMIVDELDGAPWSRMKSRKIKDAEGFAKSIRESIKALQKSFTSKSSVIYVATIREGEKEKVIGFIRGEDFSVSAEKMIFLQKVRSVIKKMGLSGYRDVRLKNTFFLADGFVFSKYRAGVGLKLFTAMRQDLVSRQKKYFISRVINDDLASVYERIGQRFFFSAKDQDPYFIINIEGDLFSRAAQDRPAPQQGISVRTNIPDPIRVQFEASGGQVDFATFMKWVNDYYYNSKPKIGQGQEIKDGGFSTFAEQTYFGRSIARQMVDVWKIMLKEGKSRNSKFSIVEAGAGNGTLARNILDYLQKEEKELYQNLEYVIVDFSGPLQEIQRANLSHHLEKMRFVPRSIFDVAAKDIGSVEGVFISNELVDDLPGHLLYSAGRRGMPQEVFLELKDGQLTEVYKPLSFDLVQYLERSGTIRFPVGRTFLARPIVEQWQKVIGESLKKGVVITIDYGGKFEENVEGSKPTVWSGAAQTMHLDKILEEPGKGEITADVDFEEFARAGERVGFVTSGFTYQRDFLISLDVDQDILSPNQWHSVSSNYGFKVLMQSKGVKDNAFRGLQISEQGLSRFYSAYRQPVTIQLPSELRNLGEVYYAQLQSWDEIPSDPENMDEFIRDISRGYPRQVAGYLTVDRNNSITFSFYGGEISRATLPSLVLFDGQGNIIFSFRKFFERFPSQEKNFAFTEKDFIENYSSRVELNTKIAPTPRYFRIAQKGEERVLQAVSSGLLTSGEISPDLERFKGTMTESAWEQYVEWLTQGGFTPEDQFDHYDKDLNVYVLSQRLTSYLGQKLKMEDKMQAVNFLGFVFVSEDTFARAQTGDKEALTSILHENLHIKFREHHPGSYDMDVSILDELYAFFASYLEFYGDERIDGYAGGVAGLLIENYLDKFIYYSEDREILEQQREEYAMKIQIASKVLAAAIKGGRGADIMNYVLSSYDLGNIIKLVPYESLARIGFKITSEQYNAFCQKASSSSLTSQAQEEAKSLGGIDFNAQNMNVETTGNAIDFALPDNITADSLMNIKGLTPVIINITPITSFYQVMGLAEEHIDQVSLVH